MSLQPFDLPALEPTAVVQAAEVPGVYAPAVDPRAAAHAEADAIREQARQEGYAAGLDAARAEVGTLAETLVAAAAGMEELRSSVAEQVERAAVDLGLRIAEQALGAAVAVDPELIVEAVRGALRRLAERERTVILVNPDDLDAVRGAIGELAASLGGIDHCDVQAERRVTRGGAVVRTAEGEIDATVETKLARAREVIEHELAGT